MADKITVPQYPDMFDPSQMSNAYSNYKTGALPWPSSYVGSPTDATGRPIASYQAPQPVFTPNPAPSLGTTLNSWGGWNKNPINGVPTAQQRSLYAYLGLGDPGARGGTSGGTWSTPNNSAAYLGALANPSHVTTPGTYVAPSYQPSGDVFNTILSQLRAQGAQSQAPPPGIGGGSQGLTMNSNTGFLNALAALHSGAAPTSGAGTGTA